MSYRSAWAAMVERLPEGDKWLYEVKLDGYRALLIRDAARVESRSRNTKDRGYSAYWHWRSSWSKLTVW
jgi:ATP-dependent DNA ligase